MHYPFRALKSTSLHYKKWNRNLITSKYPRKRAQSAAFWKIVYKEGRWYKTVDKTWCSLDNSLARYYPREGSITNSLPAWRPLEEFWDHNRSESTVISDIVSRDFFRDVFLSRRDVGRRNFSETKDRLKKKLQARGEEYHHFYCYVYMSMRVNRIAEKLNFEGRCCYWV